MSPRPLGIVGGTGIALEDILDSIDRTLPFEDVPGLPQARVAGHMGRFVFGQSQGHPVVVQSGRLHVYEGLSIAEAAQTVDALASFGVGTVLFTNAAGGLHPETRPGDLLAVDNVRPLPFRNWQNAPESIQPDIAVPGCEHTGSYLWVHGPSYETRAEIHALQELGGDAVGMSTAPELTRCNELGIRTSAISCITNNCCTSRRLTHEHVLETARQASHKLVRLIREALPKLANTS